MPATPHPATIPNPVPARLIPPLAPAATGCQVVIIQARGERAFPVSLATVSVAASQRAARPPASRRGCPPGHAMAAAAMLRLAKTCDAERSRPGLPVPAKRVAAHVKTNTMTSAAKPAAPPPVTISRQQSVPATAPLTETPRRILAPPAKSTVNRKPAASRPRTSGCRYTATSSSRTRAQPRIIQAR